MDISKIEIGAKYKCDYNGAQYFGHVKELKGGKVYVQLRDKINKDGDAGDPIDRRGDTPVCLDPENIHPMSCEL
jgi:hypothetical protein